MFCLEQAKEQALVEGSLEDGFSTFEMRASRRGTGGAGTLSSKRGTLKSATGTSRRGSSNHHMATISRHENL